MKLLLNPTLMQISDAISVETNEVSVVCRIESYSCKMIAQEKKMFKQLVSDHEPNTLEVLSPAAAAYGNLIHSLSPSNLSPSVLSKSYDQPPDVLRYSISTRTLYYLKATLNTVFAPDYDFSNAKSEEFSKEPSIDFVRSKLFGHLAAVRGDDVPQLSAALWQELEKEIAPSECDIYSYRPDGDSDPFGEEGSLWSINFFLYNKRLKRIVFIRAHAISQGMPSEDEGDYGEGNNLEIDAFGGMSDDDDDDGVMMDVSNDFSHHHRGMPGVDLSYLE